MSDLDRLIDKIDHAVSQSRLNCLAVMLTTDRAERLARIEGALARLKPGAYLLGTGPSTVAIIPLTVEEVVLGRSATPGEKPAEVLVDYQVADTLYLGPHEVSRVHAKVVRTQGTGKPRFSVVDLRSRCGTYLNGNRIGPEGCRLRSGDLLSLGSTQVSTYMFLQWDAR
jgi:pSer/pThr/pTyr-binding forkhead associated (FHA) protein